MMTFVMSMLVLVALARAETIQGQYCEEDRDHTGARQYAHPEVNRLGRLKALPSTRSGRLTRQPQSSQGTDKLHGNRDYPDCVHCLRIRFQNRQARGAAGRVGEDKSSEQRGWKLGPRPKRDRGTDPDQRCHGHNERDSEEWHLLKVHRDQPGMDTGADGGR